MRARALALVALLAACGPGSYGEFRQQLVDRTCSWAVRCGYAAQADRAACPVDSLLVLFFDSAVDRAAAGAYEVEASIDKGRMRYDSVNAGDCLDAIADAPCDLEQATQRRKRACNAVVAARTQTDRACWSDFECTGGICVQAPGCVGSCGAFASFGAPCLDTATAPVAQRCDPSVGYCASATPDADPTCQRKKAEGADCLDSRECRFGWTCRLNVCVEPVELDENEPCGGADLCKVGRFCDPTTLLCAKQRAAGESCVSTTACQDGLGCLGLQPVEPDGGPAVVSAPGVCAPWLTIGAACSQPTPGTVSGCPSSSATCTGGVCTALAPVAGLGDSCADRPCADGLGCDARGRCDFLRAIFGDCSRDRAKLCEPGLVCAATGTDAFEMPGVCLPPTPPACFAVSDG